MTVRRTTINLLLTRKYQIVRNIVTEPGKLAFGEEMSESSFLAE
jgi:hypothetical protein